MSNNVVDQVLAQQQKRASQQQTFESTDLTKYFTIALPQGVTRGEKTFRILPSKDGGSPFIEVWFHSIKVGGKQRKLYDPGKNEGKPSPLTDVYTALKASGDLADKNLANNYKPRLFYVLKGIEREKEHEGVKFWRFPHDNKGGGIFDLVSPMFKKFGNITDPLTGRDLSLTVAKIKNPKGGEYTAVTAILPNDPSPLSVDKTLQDAWLADESTWENVYKKYDTDYLYIIADGYIPMWSETEKKWIAKPDTDDSEGTGNQDTIGAPLEGKSATEKLPETDHPATEGYETNGISDDDLPF